MIYLLYVAGLFHYTTGREYVGLVLPIMKNIQLAWAFLCKSDEKKLLLLDLMSSALNATFYAVRQ